jgi:16S rRNA (uracil1498-N3)-methyltransferase
MRVSRFYTSNHLSVDNEIQLESEVSHYISRVLRLKTGDPLVLFNGDGCDYPAEILELSKNSVLVLVNSQLNLAHESPLHIHLAQGVSKGDRMDFAIQKAVELGVAEITPVITERCVVKMSKERWLKKHEQWKKIIISACEQSNRNVIPVLNPTVELAAWQKQTTEDIKVVLSPKSRQYLSHMARPNRGIRLLIGPEGGLSEQEVYTCEQTGFFAANMGPRILRTETAALTSIAILQSLFGDL